MKTIYKIAKAELQTLFYSPIAWLILIIFTFQCSMSFSNLIDGFVRSQSLGYGNYNVTLGIYSGMRGLFTAVQSYLYLYIPLLTMSLMSRELGSGSIKLLYSSPVTNTQIILGKYFSMMIYALVLIGILMVYTIYSACVVKDFDFPVALSGMLGVYLLICAYAAIGLFMSSLTSYQIVAAVGTLAILAALSYVKGLWQEIDFVRDITFWLAIDGRASEFVNGLICSEDILYFLIVIVLFLWMSIIRLQSRRQKASWMVTWGKYIGVWAIALFIGYLSSRPALMSFYDTTFTKQNTLTKNSQNIVAKMDGKLKITTYVNILDQYSWIGSPSYRNWDLRSFRQYVRFKPDIEMEYIHYYDSVNFEQLDKQFPNTTMEEKARKMIEIEGLDSNKILKPEQIREIIDLSGEKNRFVRLLERENGQKTFLRVFDDMMVFPGETEISAAFKRIVMKLPKVGFLTGHGERNTEREGDRDYSSFTQDKPFRYSLINQGFDFENLTLDKEIPEDVNILVIAEMRQPMTDTEKENFEKYIARGGNLFIVGEPKRQDVMNPVIEQFGVQFMPGILVRPTENFQADLIVATPTQEAADFSYIYKTMKRREYVATMPSATGLDYVTDKGFEVTPLFVSDTINCWNELQTTNFVDDTARFNPSTGEIQKSFVTGLALSRKVGDREQKIMIFGDADCVSNGEFSRGRKGIRASNFSIIQGAFFWLSDEEVPIDVRRPTPPDNEVYVGETGAYVSKIGFMGVFPVILLFVAIFIWIRRRGR